VITSKNIERILGAQKLERSTGKEQAASVSNALRGLGGHAILSSNFNFKSTRVNFI